VNNVSLIGNICNQPEVRYTASGTAVMTVNLAVNEKEKKGEQWVDKPVFIDVQLWKQKAEFINQYAKKGSKIGVTGKLDMQQWQDKQSGQNRSKLFVVALDVQLLDAKQATQQNQQQVPLAAPVFQPQQYTTQQPAQMQPAQPQVNQIMSQEMGSGEEDIPF
jgi:single-strand DNA-binding protein